MVAGGAGDGLEELRAAIDALVVAPDADAIAGARELASRLDAVIASAEADYVRDGRHEVDGYGDVASFVRHRCRTTVAESRRVARRARRLAVWPELADAWRHGRVTAAQVDLVCAVIPARHVERFAATIDDTLTAIGPLSAHHSGIVLRRWARYADDLAQREAAEDGHEPVTAVPARELSASRTLDDVLVLRGSIDADAAAVVERALGAATSDDAPGERRTPTRRRADALVTVCEAYLAALENPDGNRRRERLTVVTDLHALYRAWLRGAGVVTAGDLDRFLAAHPALGPLDRGLFSEAFDGAGGVAATLDGHPVTDALVAAVASRGTLELLLTAHHRPLRLGRSTRTFTAAQRRAVLTRDQGCRNCGAEPSRCDIHHVTPWEHGGCTDLDNAVALCRRCHHLLHRRRWNDRIEPDGTYTHTGDRGTTRTTPPPGHHHLPRPPVATTSRPARPAPPPTLPPRRERPGPPGWRIRRLRYRHLVVDELRLDMTGQPDRAGPVT